MIIDRSPPPMQAATWSPARPCRHNRRDRGKRQLRVHEEQIMIYEKEKRSTVSFKNAPGARYPISQSTIGAASIRSAKRVFPVISRNVSITFSSETGVRSMESSFPAHIPVSRAGRDILAEIAPLLGSARPRVSMEIFWRLTNPTKHGFRRSPYIANREKWENLSGGAARGHQRTRSPEPFDARSFMIGFRGLHGCAPAVLPCKGPCPPG